MQKHTILFLAADPSETGRLALDREARAIQTELESAGYRDRFELETRWAVEPLDLLRQLRKLKPTIVHFSSYGRRDGEQRHGLSFQGLHSRARFVSAQAIEQTFGAAGSSVKLVMLNACYSDVQAEALLAHVDCVVGTTGSIRDDAARSFAIGFYGGLGERESVMAAFAQGRAAISLMGLHDRDLSRIRVRAEVDASQLVLASDPPACRIIQIEKPQHGDLLIGPSIISGTGPAGAAIFIRSRSLLHEGEDPFTVALTRADSGGRWETIAFANDLWGGPPAPGPYELHAATSADQLASRPITIFYRDMTPAREVARIVRARHRLVEVHYELHTAFVEATKLKRGQCLLSRSITAPLEALEASTIAAGEQIATYLDQLVARQPLDVRITIDADRHVSFEPGTAWGLYYAFPESRCPAPSTNVNVLQLLRVTQHVWELTPRVSQIPEYPFGAQLQASQTYLEVRHDGYRPEFVRLDEVFPRTYAVRLSPVLQKRIAVLNFPCADSDQQVPSFSQLIAHSMAITIERRPSLAPFAYFSESPADHSTGGLLDLINRPAIEFGNQVLTLDDVQAMQSELESIDTCMVSGEGRHLRRKAVDIQYLIRGKYRLLNEE